MKRKTKTDTSTQLTAEEHSAFLRIHHATAGEDRWKSGLEYICNRLDDARGNAEVAAERILPEVADVKLNPASTLESLCATPPEWRNAVKLPELCERIFDQLKKEIAIKPDVELLRRKRINWHGETRLEVFAFFWFVFLFGWNGDGGCYALLRKKVELARVLGKCGAADKLDEAFRQIMPALRLSNWEKDAKRFAAEITPDDFHVAFRNALKLDADATDEINGEEKNTGTRNADELKAELGKDLAPDKSKTDAIQYCARLVCHVWNTRKHGGKKNSTDYVFIKAKKGDSLFGVCKRVRELVEKWAISTGTVMTNAARLHAAQRGTKHKKRDGMERPETMHEAAKKSRAKEQADKTRAKGAESKAGRTAKR